MFGHEPAEGVRGVGPASRRVARCSARCAQWSGVGGRTFRTSSVGQPCAVAGHAVARAIKAMAVVRAVVDARANRAVVATPAIGALADEAIAFPVPRAVVWADGAGAVHAGEAVGAVACSATRTVDADAPLSAVVLARPAAVRSDVAWVAFAFPASAYAVVTTVVRASRLGERVGEQKHGARREQQPRPRGDGVGPTPPRGPPPDYAPMSHGKNAQMRQCRALDQASRGSATTTRTDRSSLPRLPTYGHRDFRA